MIAVTMEIIGREEELAAVDAFLDGIEEGPSALVLSGEPGIGKTVLWEAGVGLADGTCCLLSHRSAEAEAALSFTGLSDLLAPVFDEVGPLLAPFRRRALEVALLLVEPDDGAPDPRAIGLALLDVLRTLAEQSPVLLALDDLQWLDPSSAGVLQIALRRLEDERVRLLATVRRPSDTASLVGLETSFPEDRRSHLELGPLSLAALRRLLGERIGLELTRPEVARVRAASAGNPFFALEFGRELVRTGTRPSAGQELRVPESLQELLGDRLARLPTETGDVLLEVAALARPTVDVIAEAHGDRQRVVEALEAAVREAVVEVDGSQIRFVHPLLASICYQQAPVWKRRAVHRALAAALPDVEGRARHLALSADGPDAVVASHLDTAGEQAAARGAPVAAGELFELAAELTPDDPALGRRRLVRAAQCHRLTDGDRAAALLEQLLDDVPPGFERADVLFELVSTQRADSDTMIELLGEALVEAEGDDVRLTRILGYRAWIRLFQADVRAALADARASLEKAERVGDPDRIAAAIGGVATAESRAGEFTSGLLERGVEIEERLGLVLEYRESPSVALTRRLIGQGELGQARAILEKMDASAAARGDQRFRGLVAGSLARLEWFAGDWQAAVELVERAAEINEQTNPAHAPAYTGRLRALSEADLGRVEQARASASAALSASEAMFDREWTILIRGVLGRLELMLGDVKAALGYLGQLPGQLLSMGYQDPTAPLWADAIEALVAAGELDQARSVLESYQASAERLGSPWALAVADRCRGLLVAREGDLPAAFAYLERSRAELERLPFLLERGRTLLCLGTVRRQAQQRRAAREALEEALEIFEELGAQLWAERARAEFGRISGRAPASEELTETERRVAELAAQGRTNKEIATELFMGVSTVEAHLSRVYRKLGIRSRAGLAGRLEAVEAR
ncbi:MAG TPA: AAA family ATPase [Gaiellaceae bacterium]|nr:AAA family ATPase [Gaiellaceae bacterium]